ncbi:MAG TPA: hypothetical protein VHZ32_03265 [Rhizomicrobium sp.]|nr:hypothetical protein [Rhizomicrobium sp.]
MSQILDPVGAAPETRRLSFLAIVFGVSAAPIFWLGQLMLGYGVTAFACYPGDHPAPAASTAALKTALIAFDAVAVLACAAGGAVSWWCWQRSKDEKPGGHRHALHTGEGRVRFLALWGLMSNIWFFGAILFNTIASVTVPPCLI